ncbi:MAG: hypothetical protein M3Z05_17750 [Gemmatimonadota bacterium]|nr:hypothetical protein [Gemmatimonadota bacterium]
MRRVSPASILATAASGLLFAGCSTESTPTSLKQIDPVARFSIGPSATSAPEPGRIKICKNAASNVSGTFTVSSTPANGGSATVLSPTTVAPGSCTIVAEDFDGADVGSYNTPTETSAGFVSVTAKFVSRSASGVNTTSDIAYTPGQALFLNQFHGYTLTYVNHVDAPPGAKCPKEDSRQGSEKGQRSAEGKNKKQNHDDDDASSCCSEQGKRSSEQGKRSSEKWGDEKQKRDDDDASDCCSGAERCRSDRDK